MRDIFALFSACHRYHHPARSTRWAAYCSCRIRLDATSGPDSESWSEAGSNLRVSDRIIAGLCTFLMRPVRVLRSAIAFRPSTLMHFHKMLTKQKYRMLFSPKQIGRPGPKGPTRELIDAVVEMKRRNRTWGCKRIAQQIALAFGVEIDKDVVRRILGIHFQAEAGSGGATSILRGLHHEYRLEKIVA
jgi:hypothetical protein